MKSITKPLVSVITPSFNQGAFIRETIESVISQDYSPLEYLVIDGGSTDKTVEILNSYGDRFFWVSEKDRGQADAVNKGWRRARGEILAWLNSDDIYYPGAVSKAVSFLQEHREFGAVYGEGYHIEKDGSVMERYPTEPFDRKRLLETCYICQPTVFIRRSVLEAVGFLDDKLHYCMDYDLWFRIAAKFEFGYLPEYLAGSRMYRENKTLSKRVPVHQEILDMFYRHHGYVPSSWVNGYSHAVLERFFNRSQAWQNYIFILGLIGINVRIFWRYNRRFPFAECRKWRKLLLHHLSRRMMNLLRGRKKAQALNLKGPAKWAKRDG